MKRKLALLLAAVMVAAMVPVSAFAKTDSYISGAVKVEKDTILDDVIAPVLTIEDKYEHIADASTAQQFYLTLEGAEWDVAYFGDDVEDAEDGINALLENADATWMTKTLLSVVPTIAAETEDGEIVLPLEGVKVTGDEAKITISGNNLITADAFTFAYTAGKGADAKVAKMVNVPVEGGEVQIKDILVTEAVAGTLKPGKDITLRLYGNYEFVDNQGKYDDEGNFKGIKVTGDNTMAVEHTVKVEKDEITITLNKDAKATTSAAMLVINGIDIKPTRDTVAGEIAEIYIKGAGVNGTALEVAQGVDYGVTFTVEDKKLPVFYSGRTYSAAKEEYTLAVKIAEVSPDSWWTDRRTTLVFPEGIEVVAAKVVSEKNTNLAKGALLTFGDDVENEVDIEVKKDDHKALTELELKFVLAVAPDFAEGEIKCQLTGPAVPDDMEVTVAEAQYPVTFEVEVKDVSIDYRHVAVGDIVIKEAFAGALEKDDVLTLNVEWIGLEKGVKITVEEGDIKLEEDKPENSGDLAFEVKRASYKTPAVIRISNVEAFLERNIPAGEYPLTLGYTPKAQNAYFKNYVEKDSKALVNNGLFDIDEIELAPAYINVITAGRDQDDSSFTTQIKVTVGADTMVVGQGTIALDVPAYIANGYTMLPVRAVADALSANAATVLWNGETQTVTIAFGARIISMTIGSKVMNINGVEIGMNAAPELVNNRTFLPLRDLGYALGLTDADIAWDDATKTATLN